MLRPFPVIGVLEIHIDDDDTSDVSDDKKAIKFLSLKETDDAEVTYYHEEKYCNEEKYYNEEENYPDFGFYKIVILGTRSTLEVREYQSTDRLRGLPA